MQYLCVNDDAKSRQVKCFQFAFSDPGSNLFGRSIADLRGLMNSEIVATRDESGAESWTWDLQRLVLFPSLPNLSAIGSNHAKNRP